MRPFSVIIAGVGRAGGDLHLDAYRAIEPANVVALCDPDAERTRRLCADKGVPNAYPSLAEGLAKHDVDVVSVCSPVQTHLELAKAAMDAGAHVIMEKPIAMTAAEAEEMKAYSQEKDRRLGIVHNTKFQPGVQKALRIFQDGGIGEVLHIDQTWLRVGAQDRMLQGDDYWVNELIGGR